MPNNDDSENCLNCMHCVVRFGNFVCNEPRRKRNHRNPLERIINGNGHCELWDTLDETVELNPTKPIGAFN